MLRRKPVAGYDISFLITNFHCETMFKHKLVAFVCVLWLGGGMPALPHGVNCSIQFMKDVDADVKDLKTKINARARVAATRYLQTFI